MVVVGFLVGLNIILLNTATQGVISKVGYHVIGIIQNLRQAIFIVIRVLVAILIGGQVARIIVCQIIAAYAIIPISQGIDRIIFRPFP